MAVGCPAVTDPPLHYVAVGHLCVDELATGEERLGGTVFFSAGQAAAMGCRVTVVTSCTSATADRARRELPDAVELVVDEAAVDTRFGFADDAALGPQRLVSRAPTIDRLPDVGPIDVLHLAPVFAELGGALLGDALLGDALLGDAGASAARLVGATPQGLLRTTTDAGTLGVDPAHWPTGRFAEWLVLSHDEFDHASDAGLLAASGRDGGGVFRTLGPDGAELWTDGGVVAACAPVDTAGVVPQRTIGAGDVFAAAAFVPLASGASATDALVAAVASATAYVRRPTTSPTFVDGRAPEPVASVRLGRVVA